MSAANSSAISAILAAYLVVVIAVGIWLARRQKSASEYFHGTHDLPWWAVGFSLSAQHMSAVTFLGFASWVVAKDSRYVIGYAGGQFIAMVLATVLWARPWRGRGDLSVFEYLEARFHLAARMMGVATGCFLMISWIGSGAATMAIATEPIVGIPAVWLAVALIAVGAIYSLSGGVRAIVWTDVLQLILLGLAFIAVILFVLERYDWSFAAMYTSASSVVSQSGRPVTTLVSGEFSFAIESTAWVLIARSVCSGLRWGTMQVHVQRSLATRSLGDMRKAMLTQAVIVCLFMGATVIIGWCLSAVYHDAPQLAEALSHPDQIVTHFARELAPPWLVALIALGLLSAMMSSVDSALNSLCAIGINDFYRRFVPARTEAQEMRLARLATVLAAAVILAFTLWQIVSTDSILLERLGKFRSVLVPPMICLFVLGFFSSVGTSAVLIAALCAAAAAIVVAGIPGLMEPSLAGINWMWALPMSVAVGLATAPVIDRARRALLTAARSRSHTLER